MTDILDNVYLGIKFRVGRFIEDFKSDERGVSAFVATVLIILIAVAFAAIFWDALKDWFSGENGVWKKVTGAKF